MQVLYSTAMDFCIHLCSCHWGDACVALKWQSVTWAELHVTVSIKTLFSDAAMMLVGARVQSDLLCVNSAQLPYEAYEVFDVVVWQSEIYRQSDTISGNNIPVVSRITCRIGPTYHATLQVNIAWQNKYAIVDSISVCLSIWHQQQIPAECIAVTCNKSVQFANCAARFG